MNKSQQVKELKNRNEKKLNLALKIQKALSTDDGKILLEHLSSICNEHAPTFVDQNPSGSAYKEGQRSVILNIRSMLNKNINEIKQGKAEING